MINLLLVPFVTVKTPQQLDSLSFQTYIFGAIVGVIFLLGAALIAGLIKYEGGATPRDPFKRRLWFWILMIGSFIVFFLYNLFFVAPSISLNLQSDFMATNIIGSVITIVVYLLVGFILSKVFSTGKIGNWFSFKK